MLNFNSPRHGTGFSAWAYCYVLALLCCSTLFAQTTLSTGSINGTVTDPSGAVVSDAKVTITRTSTGQKVELTSNAAGAFTSGPLAPDTYKVQISSKGFSSI